MSFPFEKLNVYRKSVSFSGEIEKLCRELKGKVSYSILDQLTRATISIPLNIAEGNGRWYAKEKLQFLRIARGSIFETVAIIQILKEGHHITEQRYGVLYAELETQVKMLASLAKYLSDADAKTS